MTDSQWLWLYANQCIDNDERLESMCDKCKQEVTSKNKCTRCGKTISLGKQMINPNFDYKRFNQMSLSSTDYTDIGLLKQINK